MQQGVVRAAGLVTLMLMSILMGYAPPADHLDDRSDVRSSNTTGDQSFTGLTSSISGSVGDVITPTVPIHYGYSMTNGQMNLTLEGSQTSSTSTYSVASGLLNGTLNATVNDGSSIQLVSAMAGPPQAGTNSSTILSSTSMSGTHQYDTLELLCGIASCGSIVATGDLTLYVNTLRVEQGTSILANDLATGGQGAGTSTTTATNGRNDGGGGAGHGAAGGAGGGTGGGTGGTAYGNGTERGSQGGSVSSSYHSAATGGNGGGYLRIFANQIFVNGSIHANGGNGDSGSQASSGTGAGGSGAGGGSGGGIFIQANSVSVGNGGQIKANGGSGGNGANGAQNGPGFGMYDGGDGGGGGAGGRIVINTQVGSYTNSGTVQAAFGNGGTKGYKYGTGIDGVDGSAGSTGTFVFNTWGGYLSSGNVTANNGTFTTHPLNTQSGSLSTAYLTHSTSVPASSSLTATYRYTVNGTNTSFAEWSSWAPLSLSGEWVPHHTWIQLEYNFSRTGSASPELNSLSVQTSAWSSLSNLEFKYDGEAIEPNLAHTSFGFTTAFNDTSTPQQPQFTFDVPEGTVFADDLSVWMQWEDASPSTPFYTQARIGSTVVNTEAKAHADEGMLLSIDLANLSQSTPTSTYHDTAGIKWNTYMVNVDMSASTEVWFDRLSLPWSVEIPVNMTNAMNNAILGDCGSFSTFTAGVCFGQATLHRFTLTGTTLPSGSTAFTFTLDEPAFSWEDTYAPQLSSIQHRKGIEQLPDIRVNESFSMVLFDVADEDDLSVEYLGLDWEEADGFGASQTMNYHNGLKGYYIYLNTDGLEVDLEHHYNMTFRLVDAQGNELLPRPTYNLIVYPTAPEVSTLSLTGPTKLSGSTVESTWDINDAQLLIKVSETNLRQNLNVMVDLTHQGLAPPMTLPLLWDPSQAAYAMDWSPQRQDLGEWHLEVSMEEMGGLMATDENGWQDGVDAVVHLVDATGPLLTSLSVPSKLEPNEPLNVAAHWTTSPNEQYAGSISVTFEGQEVANKTIITTQANNTSLLFTTEGWAPGTYTVLVHLHDDAGNEATVGYTESNQAEIMKPRAKANLTLDYDGMSTLHLHGHVETRSGMATLTLEQANSAWSQLENMEDGNVSLTYTLTDFSITTVNLTLTVCDAQEAEDCLNQTYEFDISEAFAVNATSSCDAPTINRTSSENQTLVVCEITNLGLTSITVAYVEASEVNTSAQSTTVNPGSTSSITLLLNAGTSDVNESVTWTLVATNSLGEQKVLDAGARDVERSLPKDQPTTDETEGSSGNANIGMWFVIGGLLLAGLAVAYFYRKETSGEIKAFDHEVMEGPHTEEESLVEHHPLSPQATVPTPQDPRPSTGPAAGAAPTSTDANGYEWFSSADGHWYRTAGSNTEWIPFQQE